MTRDDLAHPNSCTRHGVTLMCRPLDEAGRTTASGFRTAPDYLRSGGAATLPLEEALRHHEWVGYQRGGGMTPFCMTGRVPLAEQGVSSWLES